MVDAISQLGEEITWEILGSEGVWHVTAYHRGSDDDADNFKFSASDEILSLAIIKAAASVIEGGPGWVFGTTAADIPA